jgi:hypothetical protein
MAEAESASASVTTAQALPAYALGVNASIQYSGSARMLRAPGW